MLDQLGDWVEFRILGPLEVIADSGPLDAGGPRQQAVLATLLLSANRVVTVDRLLESLYGERAPATGRSQVQIAVSGLRRLFARAAVHSATAQAAIGTPATRTTPADSSDSVITTHAQGYLIRTGSGRLDAARFADLVAAARAARDAGQPGQAVASYREALRLWRGPALAGLDSDVIRRSADYLDEQRIISTEDRIRIELELGRHHEMAGELTRLIGEFPLREELRRQLMLALYRCGRTADALAAYRDARQVMIDELGIEPNDQLRQLERAILATDPRLDLPRPAPKDRPLAAGNLPAWLPQDRPVRTATAWVNTAAPPPGPIPEGPVHEAAQASAPCLLPADIADFTGRSKQVDEIHQYLLAAVEDDATLAVPIAAISGKGGIGKTSLAVHAAHGLATRFPGGQLFADLHGASDPVSPMKVLDRFLRALGLSGAQIPDSLEDRAEEFRALLAGRRILVLLDDAATEAQVSPLLPGSPTSAVIVTSRGRLAGLAGAAHVGVDVFDADKSVEMLTQIAGAERVAAESHAAAEVAALCGHHPLALRIAGTRLCARQHWSVQQLADRLSDEAGRLDELRYRDMAVRASISLSYDGASQQARRLFRRLAVLTAPSFPGWVAAALLDEPAEDAGDLLDELVGAQLIEAGAAGLPGHYRFHDLIRLFARERLAAEETAASRRAALERVLGALLALAEEADRPLAWFERERATLLSGVRRAAEAGLAELCWRLARSAVTLYEPRFYLDDWRETHQIALDAVREAGDRPGQAAILCSAGRLAACERQALSALSAAQSTTVRR